MDAGFYHFIFLSYAGAAVSSVSGGLFAPGYPIGKGADQRSAPKHCSRGYSLLQAVQISDDFGGVIRRFYRVIGCSDLAIGADQHRLARRTGTVRLRYAISDRYRTVLVAYEVIGKREFFTKRTIIGGAVIADAEDDRVTVFKVLDSITEPVAFDRSAGCVGFGVPPEQDVTAGEVVFLHRSTVLVREAEIRRVNAGSNQCHSGFSIG
ncbi:MAG: hypothetical protein ACI9JL_000463 [Paracoccaceae bacterium]|jgi:hypothetical protein